jgi:lipoprotein NlpI
LWHIERGQKYEFKGMHNQAIAAFTQAIIVDPNNAAAYINRAGAYTAKGDRFRAALDYAKINEFFEAWMAEKSSTKKKTQYESNTDWLGKIVSVGKIVFNILAG